MRKYIFMVMLGIFTLSFTVVAQNREGRRSIRQNAESTWRWDAKERAANMATQLDLTDAQKAEIEKLFEEQDKKREEQMTENRAKREELRSNREALRNNRENVETNRDARRSEMQELRIKAVEENNAAVEKIIGKEKLEQWQKYLEENRRGTRSTSGRR